jgi:hypothetical protein
MAIRRSAMEKNTNSRNTAERANMPDRMDRPEFYQGNSNPPKLRNLPLRSETFLRPPAARRGNRNRLNASLESERLENSGHELSNVIEHHAPIMRDFQKSFNKFRYVLAKKVKKVHLANNSGRPAIGGQANRRFTGTRNCSRPRKGDRHSFPGNCSAMLFDRIGRHLKKRGKIEPVPGP